MEEAASVCPDANRPGTLVGKVVNESVTFQPSSQVTSTGCEFAVPILGQNSAWLACYWQNLAVAPGQFPTSNTCSSGGGTPHGINPGTPYAVTVTADPENCTQNLNISTNCLAGGVPSAPALSAGCSGCPAPAVQAVVTLNLSSDANLTYLLAALLDNNTTVASGQLGVNGHFVNITGELPTLGLNSVVLSALANATLVNDGAFSQPVSNIQSSSPSWFSAIASVVWNTVSGVAHAISVAWNYAVAAASYLYHAAVSLAQHLADTVVAVADHAISVLKQIASAMLAALQALLAFVKDAIVTFLRQTFASLSNEMTQLSKAYASPVFRGLQSRSGLGEAVFGGQMLFLLTLGATITTVLFIALGLVSAVSFGIGDAVLLIIPLLITLLFQALGNNQQLGTSGDALVGQPFGKALWQGIFPPLHDSINATASAEHLTLDSNAQQSADQTIANVRTSTDLTAGFLGFGLAAGLAVSKLGPLAKVLLAGLGLGMGIAAFYIFWYLDTTTQSNQQITSADGQAADVISGAEAFLGSLLVILALATSNLPEPAEIVFTLILILLGITLSADLVLYIDGFLASQ